MLVASFIVSQLAFAFLIGFFIAIIVRLRMGRKSRIYFASPDNVEYWNKLSEKDKKAWFWIIEEQKVYNPVILKKHCNYLILALLFLFLLMVIIYMIMVVRGQAFN